MVNNPTAKAGDTGLISGLGRLPGEGDGNPLQYSCLENPMGYSPWGCKKLDTIEHTFTIFLYHLVNNSNTPKLIFILYLLCIQLYAAAAAKLLQSCPTLCDPIDGSPPGSSRYLKYVLFDAQNNSLY